MVDEPIDFERLRDEFRNHLFEMEEQVSCLRAAVEELSAPPVVKFKKFHPDAVVPTYQSDGAVGMDLVACNDEPITVMPGAPAVLIPTGIGLELPDNYEAQIRPRSGISLKGIDVANSPGTIDRDFSAAIAVIVRNHGHMFTIHKGDRIAQLVIARAVPAKMVEVQELTPTKRGAGGFGSTGI